jgi:hypothetical protein
MKGGCCAKSINLTRDDILTYHDVACQVFFFLRHGPIDKNTVHIFKKETVGPAPHVGHRMRD